MSASSGCWSGHTVLGVVPCESLQHGSAHSGRERLNESGQFQELFSAVYLPA